MRVVGLDMATRTGWAFIDTEVESHRSSGHEDFGKFSLEDRLLKFNEFVRGLYYEKCPHIIVYEIAHHRGGPATRSGIGLQTVLIMETRKQGGTAHGVHSRSLKKFATGSGRATKDEMMAMASLYSGREITDDNEADAIHLARWGVEHAEIDNVGIASIKTKQVSKRKRRSK